MAHNLELLDQMLQLALPDGETLKENIVISMSLDLISHVIKAFLCPF